MVPERCAERRQDPVATLQQDDSHALPWNRGIVAASDESHQLGERAGILHPCRTRPDDHECEPSASRFLVAFHRGRLETGEHPIAQLERVGQRRYVVSGVLEVGLIQEIDRCAGRQHQIVIGLLRSGRGEDDAPIEIHAHDFRLAEPDVRDPPKDGSYGIRDVAWIEQRTRHLIQERGEQVVVVAVEENHLHRPVRQRTSALEATETRTNDHDRVHPAEKIPHPKRGDSAVRRDRRGLRRGAGCAGRGRPLACGSPLHHLKPARLGDPCDDGGMRRTCRAWNAGKPGVDS